MVNSEIVIEVGPGKGFITREIKGKVICLERDISLIPHIRGLCWEIIVGDAREIPLRADVVVGSLPFYISRDFFINLSLSNVKKGIFVVQKEFCEKLVRGNSLVSFLTSAYFDITHFLDIPPGSFYPRPKVWASLIVLNRKRKYEGGLNLKKLQCLFNHKGKKVRRVTQICGLKVLENLKDYRVEELSEEEIWSLVSED